MDNLWMLGAIFVMGAVTFFLRAVPAILPTRYLSSVWLRALNYALPLCVMTLLVLSSLSLDYAKFDHTRLLCEIIALVLVVASYAYKRNVLISMVLGVAALNGALWLFG